jgi:uncharacterized protein
MAAWHLAVVVIAALISGAAIFPAMAQTPAEEPWSQAGLAGAYLTPGPNAPRGPAVLILAGSGPTDRDGNQAAVGLLTDAYRLLASGLAEAGIRSLRYDKRGIGDSRGLMGREEDLRFDHYVGDAIVAARWLTERPDVSGVVIAGHSEGGLVAIETVARAPIAGLVLLTVPGWSLAVSLREQLFASPMPDAVREEGLRILGRIAKGESVPDVPAHWAALFRPSVQPYLQSILTIDPALVLAKLTAPALLLRADRDLQISRAAVDALARARPDAPLIVLPEANHILKRAPADRDGNLKTYTDRNLPLDPGVLPPIIEFVRKVAG